MYTKLHQIIPPPLEIEGSAEAGCKICLLIIECVSQISRPLFFLATDLSSGVTFPACLVWKSAQQSVIPDLKKST